MEPKAYIEKEREVEIIAEPDVVIVGGGPAGIGAAVGAARAGASVMIIEAQAAFGGMWTNGLVITLAGFNNWLIPYQRCVGGVMGEWLEKAAKKGGAEDNRSWVLNSDPEIMKLVADEMLVENNVKCLLHTWVADVIIEDNHISGVIIENVDGRKAVISKVVIDCTGNGDVFARAGEPFSISEELQPMTLPFFLAGVEPSNSKGFQEELIIPFGPEPGFLKEPLLTEYTSRRKDAEVDKEILKKANQEGDLPYYGGPWFGGMRKNFPWVNTTRVYGSAVNASELTSAEMEARRDAHEIASFYKKEFVGFEDCWLMKTASTIGIRETRRLKGIYTLTKEDISLNRKFTDAIALGAWPIDVHPPKGQSGMHEMYVPLPYQIPYRALLPQELDNLIVAGRCISSSREAMGSVRVGATCGATGHAAGVAAALTVSQNKTLQTIDFKNIKQELLKQDAILELL